MPTGSRPELLTQHHYMLELKQAGVTGPVAAFKDVSAITMEAKMIEHRAADERGQTRVYRTAGQIEYGPITCKRGFTMDTSLYKWFDQVRSGQIEKARCSASLVLFNQADGEVARWNLEECWPSKITGPALDAGANNLAIEEVVLICESITRVK